MATNNREHPLLIPYCLTTGIAGFVLLIIMTRQWELGLPILSIQFWLLTVIAVLFGTFGFQIGKKYSLHVSLSVVFEFALLLSFGPLVTLLVSAISFSGAFLLRLIDVAYVQKQPLKRPWRDSLAITAFTGAMIVFVWTIGGSIYLKLGCKGCSPTTYLMTPSFLVLLLIGVVNHYVNSLTLSIYQKLRGLSTISDYFLKDSPPIMLFEISIIPVGVLLAATYQTMGWGMFYWFIAALLAIGFLLRRHSNTSKNLEDRIAELRVLNKLGRAANSTLDMDELLEQTFQETSNLMETQTFIVGLYNSDKEQIQIEKIIENGTNYEKRVIDLGESLTGYIIRNKSSVLFRDRTELNSSGVPYLQLKDSLMPESFLGVPIMSNDDVLGVITVQHEKARMFDSNHRRLLTTLADQLGSAIRNARLYADMERSLVSMRELNRLKDEFLNNISHELRTPLTVIMGWGELMAYGKLSEAQNRSAVDQINRSSNKLHNLVSSLLDLSKIERGTLKLELKELNINDCTQRAVDENQIDAATKNIELICDLAEDLPKVMVDGTRIQQIVFNLLNNAIKFTHDGGLVVVHSENIEDQILISISDNGIGIDNNMLPHIFERFSQVDSSTTRKYGGAGIGLALVKKLTEMHGGEVQVDSEPGKGSTFTIVLPVKDVKLDKNKEVVTEVKSK